LTAGREENRNCLACINLLAGEDEEFCRVYGERILDTHSAAEDCPSFEEAE
jgi:hypothetical protein